MTPRQNDSAPGAIVDDVERALSHMPCWYVSCGGSAASSFELALGAKIPRDEIAVPPGCPITEFDRFQGETNLLVWCSWRLDGGDSPLTSSDDTMEHLTAGLRRLVGERTLEAKVDLPGWDLQIPFTNDLRLRIFCDHLPGEPSFDGNWDLFLPDRTISINVGCICTIEPRSSRDKKKGN